MRLFGIEILSRQRVAAAGTATCIAMTSLGAAAAGPDPTVRGTLEVEGKVVALKHVLVVAKGNDENFEDWPQVLRVVLSDMPIPLAPATAATVTAMRAWAREAHATVALVTTDAAGANPGGVYVLIGAAGRSDLRIGATTSNQGLPLKIAGGRVSGSASFDGDNDSVLRARFEAPITAVPSTVQTGSAARQSAPAQAAMAFRQALQRDDLAAVGRVATASRLRQIEAFKAQAAEPYKAMRQSLAAGVVARVVVHGETASVVLDNKAVVELVLEDGSWKVA